MRPRKKTVIRRRPQVDPLRAKTPGTSRSAIYGAPETRPSTRADKVRPVFISTIDDPRCIEMRKQYEHDKTCDNMSDKDMQKLLAHLREYEKKCGAQRKYDKANQARDMRLTLSRAAGRRASSSMSRAEEARKRDLKAIDKRIQEREESMQKEMSVYDQKTKEMKEELRRSQEKTREEFVREWEHDKPNKYRKSSVQLLHLKTIEKNLVVMGDYTGAKEVQRIIGKQENVEVEQQQEAMNEDFRAAKTRLVADQQEQMEMLEEHRQARKELSMVLLNADLQSIKNRKGVLLRKGYSTRFPRSDGTTKTVSYGASFTHVARENGFGIQPLLPILKPPTDKRQPKIHAESTKKSIVACPPRAFTTKKPEDQPKRPVFETEPNQTRNRKKYKRLPLRERPLPQPAAATKKPEYSYYYSYSYSDDEQ